MARIVPKLNLNKTPQLVDNNSLVFAKNIRLLKDGTIGPDTSLEEVETNTGDGTHHIVHHDAITEEITTYYYSILDYKNTVKYAEHDELSDHPEFVFGNNDQSDHFDDNYHNSDKPFYSQIEEHEIHQITCYSIANIHHPNWIDITLHYDKNVNKLIDLNGLVLLVGVRKEIIDNLPLEHLDAPIFFYFVAPGQLQGNAIYDVFVQGANYVVYNPVYKNVVTETITTQEAYDEEWDEYDTIEYKGHIVGLDNKVYFFKESNYIKDSAAARAAIVSEYPNAHFVDEQYVGDDQIEFDVNEEGYVTRNGVIFRDSSIAATLFPNINDRVKIFEYDELLNTFKIVKCGWKYSGGKINGCVTLNNRGELILTICEYNTNKSIPIKHINIASCKEEDDESIYTQTPKIPISNLSLSSYYAKQIPKGVYQFFIRYQIRKGFYTTWFPCSKELFISNDHRKKTIQGGVKYAERTEDSQLSFVFNVEHLFDINGPADNTKFYKSYQLGFIISSESGIVARSWKHFEFTTSTIYFDYEQKDIEEINIDELLKVNYELFNVENIAAFKNKLYIANYNETDFNEDLQYYANQIDVRFKIKELDTVEGYFILDKPLLPIPVNTSAITHEYTTWGEQPVGDMIVDRNVTSLRLLNFGQPSEIDNNHVLLVNTNWYDISANTWDFIGYSNTYSLNVGTTIYRISIMIYDQLNGWEQYDIIDHLQGRTIDFNLDYKDVITVIPSTDVNSIKDYIAQLIKPYITNLSITTDGSASPKFGVQCVKDGVSYIKELITNVDYDPNYFITVDLSINTNIQEHPTDQYNVPFNEIMFSRIVNHSNFYVDFIAPLLDSVTVQNRDVNEYNTLMPFTKYDFYVHYVKENGITSNGYFICSKKLKRYTVGYEEVEEIGEEGTTERSESGWPLLDDDIPHQYGEPETSPDDLCVYDDNTSEFLEARINAGMGDFYSKYYKLKKPTNNCAIYPTFYNITCPDGYVACFISIHKSGSDVAQVFNHSVQSITEGTTTTTRDIGDCLELDCMLYNVLKNIKIINGVGDYILSTNSIYKSSSDTEEVIDFGKVGKLVWNNLDERNPNNIDDVCWAIFNTGTDNVDENNLLTKITPYILLNDTYVDYYKYNDLNLPAFVCRITKPDRTIADKYYVTGNDVYDRIIEGVEDPLELQINEDPLDLVSSGATEFIHSNFNLNHLFLRSDLNIKFRTYYEPEEGSENDTSKHQFIYAIDSSLISMIYELHSMYKDYTKKQYHVFNLKDNIIRFDTTVRSSDSIVDEFYKNIYYFEATDYYNVPSNRGIITNLIGVANTLYVHCEHSLFKFSDNKAITANDEEVLLQENDVFNTGIAEVFDAQFGYGGLKSREQSLITFNAYVFYDAVAKIIYAFGGEQQIGNISEPIQKIINAINPTDVRFVGDEINDRFFVNLKNNDGNVCLSFNFKAKSFIAIHDIDFQFGFHTRRHTYFEHDNYFNNSKIGWSIYRITDKININNVDYFIAYQNCYTPSLISIPDMDIVTGVNSANACIDVITNIEYEKIKVLNYINWVCSEILDYGSELNFVAEEELNRLYAGDKVRIYSDSTSTNLIELTDENGNAKLSKEHRNVDAHSNIKAVKESWQYPTYNCGVFTMNYFRDVIRNGNVYTAPNPDLFKYKEAPNIGPDGLVDLTEYSQRQNITQENSLIYGKYFVIRLIFNNRNFKIENVTFRMNDYGKTK